TAAGTAPPNTGPSPPSNNTPPPPSSNNPALNAAIAKINKALSDLKAAQVAGDFAKYGQALQELQAAINEYQQAPAAARSSPPPSPSTSASPSAPPTTSPSPSAGGGYVCS